MPAHSCLIKMKITNIGCIGPEGLNIELNNIICLVGPNNAGKSTVLRAYEAAVGNQSLSEREIHVNADGKPASVEIWTHIPEGAENIDEKWKVIDDDLRIVRSKWEWNAPGKPPVRTTWNPEINAYDEEVKASGLDSVFSSRLPQPLRIKALDGPNEEHKILLKLILEPIENEFDKLLNNENSDLKKAIDALATAVKIPVAQYAEKVEEIKDKVNVSYKGVFPHSEIHLKIDTSKVEIKPMDLLMKGSEFEVAERGGTSGWQQQGTGSQRALFWSMLEVRSELQKASDLLQARIKEISSIEKQIKKLEVDKDRVKGESTKSKKQDEIDNLRAKLALIHENMDESESHDTHDNSALPGYMLLIDEPEIALHPNAVRAAKSHLYDLARENGWQVMLSTHCPTFIDPLEDHTTIIQLRRSESHPTPKIYRSDSIRFTNDERENLKMLLQFDSALAEMFFGSYPIIIEGDTEFAAFERIMTLFPDEYPVERKPLLLRAMGKEIIPTIVKILTQFNIPFSVLHDSDSPRTKSGKKKNSAWSANDRINEAIKQARARGIRVVQRAAIPDFERHHNLLETKSDKPYEIWKAMSDNEHTSALVKVLLDTLFTQDSPELPSNEDYLVWLRNEVENWARTHAQNKPQYSFTIDGETEEGTDIPDEIDEALGAGVSLS